MVDYSASEIETDGKKEESFVSELHTHVMMYAMGDEYDIKDLKEEALWKFDKAVEAKKGQSDELTTVVEVIPTVYATTPDSDRGLRDFVVAFGVQHLERINNLPELKNAMTQAPNYMIEVLPQYFGKPQGKKKHCPKRWDSCCQRDGWKYDQAVCNNCGMHRDLSYHEIVDVS